jgi:hypothetical protein
MKKKVKEKRRNYYSFTPPRECICTKPGMVAHAYNSSYLGGGRRRSWFAARLDKIRMRH